MGVKIENDHLDGSPFSSEAGSPSLGNSQVANSPKQARDISESLREAFVEEGFKLFEEFRDVLAGIVQEVPKAVGEIIRR